MGVSEGMHVLAVLRARACVCCLRRGFRVQGLKRSLAVFSRALVLLRVMSLAYAHHGLCLTLMPCVHLCHALCIMALCIL